MQHYLLSSYPGCKGIIIIENRSVIHQLAKEFMEMKRRNASDIELQQWRQRIRAEYGREATSILEQIREHVLAVEAAQR